MRIGIDARLWDETGVGRYIRNLVQNLMEIDSNNDYVLFAGLKNSESIKYQVSSSKYQNYKIVETNIRWHTVEEQLQFPAVLEKENLDLVHFPYFSVPIFYNRPFVITIHDLIINHYPTGKASTLPSPVYYLKLAGYKFIIKKAAQKASKVIAVSNATKTEIIEHLHIPENKIAVTYEGVVDKVLSMKKNKNDTLYLIQNTRYFLYVGNAYPHKNLERLLEAFSLIVSDKKFSGVKLILIGKEDYFYRRLKEKVKALEIERNVVFTGYVPDDELFLYYKHAAATIIPSLMEGFGLPGLEAMRSECLVLASDIAVFKEIYQDSAIYFDPLAVESMHATIREVLKGSKKFTSYKEKGEKRVAAFSWEKMARETLEAYQTFDESSTGI